MASLYRIILFLLFLGFSNHTIIAKECNGNCSSCTAVSVAKADTASATDEFETFDAKTDAQTSTSTVTEQAVAQENSQPHGFLEIVTGHRLFTPLLAIFLSILAGVFVKFNKLRWTRPVFLVASIAYFGFYIGACPCPISSLEDTVLLPFGVVINVDSIIWFVALIPVTYIFGQMWCGWICHFGAVQEFLFKGDKLKAFKTERAQKIMKYIRIALFTTLIIQLVLTRSKLYCEIDPFKALFNLSAPGITAWILLGLLLLSSIFIYRPFCRAACPIGLTLGLVSLIPGAHKVKRSESCTGCKVSEKKCDFQAVKMVNGKTIISAADCINCGECFDSCVDKCSCKGK